MLISVYSFNTNTTTKIKKKHYNDDDFRTRQMQHCIHIIAGYLKGSVNLKRRKLQDTSRTLSLTHVRLIECGISYGTTT